MKRVVLAIDSFKGCLSSVEAEAAAEAGVQERWRDTEVVRIPVTDGGDGMLGVFSQLLDCKKITVGCHDALKGSLWSECRRHCDSRDCLCLWYQSS